MISDLPAQASQVLISYREWRAQWRGFWGTEVGGADTDPHDRPLAKLYGNDKGFMGKAGIIDCGMRKFFFGFQSMVFLW